MRVPALLPLLLLSAGRSQGLDNGLARTPPMGWSSWNKFGRHFTEQNFYDAADAIAANGMREAGYEYINVDGGWWAKGVRNASGWPQWSPDKYPKGLPALVDYIHSKGLKYGHYTDAGHAACDHEKTMSEGFEHQDAVAFASWGVDMIKIDACSVTNASNQTIVGRWRQELNATGRPILFSNCHNGCETALPGDSRPYHWGWAEWCATDANMWRTGWDIRPNWGSVMYNLHTMKGMGAHGAPGRWNDPDFLEVGVGHFASVNASRAHFAMWCITSAPLIASPDLKTVKKEIVDVLTDRDAISINQQYAGNAGDLLEEQGGPAEVCVVPKACLPAGRGEVWYKPLPQREAAVALLNTQTNVTVRVNATFARLASLDAAEGAACTVFDVWAKTTSRVTAEVRIDVPPQTAVFLRISACA